MAWSLAPAIKNNVNLLPSCFHFLRERKVDKDE
jgi:hypothetical protein